MKYVLFIHTCFTLKYEVGFNEKWLQKISSHTKIKKKNVIKKYGSSKRMLKHTRSSDSPVAYRCIPRIKDLDWSTILRT